MASQEELDRIYDLMDDLLWAGKFDEINSILSNMELEKQDTNVILAYLVNAKAAKSKLSSFNDFARRTIETLKDRGIEERVWKHLATMV
jgi:hypothetical protein